MKLPRRFFAIMVISFAILVIFTLSIWLIANYRAVAVIRSLPPEDIELLNLIPTPVKIDTSDNLTGFQCHFESISFLSPWGEINDAIPLDSGAVIMKFDNVTLTLLEQDNYVKKKFPPEDQELLAWAYGQQILDSNRPLFGAAFNAQPADMSLRNSIKTNYKNGILLLEFKMEFISPAAHDGFYEFDLGQIKAYQMGTGLSRLNVLHVFNQHGEHYVFFTAGAHQEEVEQFLASLRFAP